ncbi:nucleotidyltransferase [Flavobacterium sp. B183]|uniref:nucleotidyltransferase n=1 Tax=Flavobacterium sp. B183 TaxID=907046 RepID=UPI00201F00D6|nr:nucleotidyltransferase [Flavobacterium sp. B183]URC13938.1 nucleotidyltransferase [Flavobacterium sp. B183]URC14040.1 nucleotidyltransferase [Flavobacterium sp. B183]
MARTITQIHNVMLKDIASNEVLSTYLNSTSMFSIYRAFTFIIASAIWIMETYFDEHTKEVDNRLANEKPGGLPWYRTMALRFQYGFDLVADKDYYDNSNATEQQIEASKIIKYAAVNEAAESSRLILKIAGETDGVLTAFEDNSQIEAINQYIKEIRIAGVQVTVINYKADRLYLDITIKRDSLVLDDKGMSKLNGNYPIQDSLKEFMKELDFNGELRLSAIIDKLQLISGVLDATLNKAESSWINPELNDYGTPQPINVSKIAESGYFEIVTFENIKYVV